jgi:hypothetical protein
MVARRPAAWREPAAIRIAGDYCPVDCADRGADDPIGFEPRFVKRLIDAAVIGAERAAALHHEDYTKVL